MRCARRIARALGVKLETLVDSDAASGTTAGLVGEAGRVAATRVEFDLGAVGTTKG